MPNHMWGLARLSIGHADIVNGRWSLRECGETRRKYVEDIREVLCNGKTF